MGYPKKHRGRRKLAQKRIARKEIKNNHYIIYA